MRKRFCIAIAIAVLFMISACDGGLVGKKMTEPPEAEVSAGNIIVNAVVSKKVWDDEIYENISSLNSALNNKMTLCVPDEIITMNFGECSPDKITVKCTDYKVTADEMIMLKDVSLGYMTSGDLITVDSCNYDPETDIRLYTVEALWNNDFAEYAFVLRNVNNIENGAGEDEFPLECEYYVFSAPYDQAHSHSGGTFFATDYAGFDEFVRAHNVEFETDTAEDNIFDKYNVIITYDFDSVTPTYLSPEVTLSNGRIDVVKREEYKGRLDTTMAVRGYFTLVSKEVCEAFDITGEDNIYYSWGKSDVTYSDKEE